MHRPEIACSEGAQKPQSDADLVPEVDESRSPQQRLVAAVGVGELQLPASLLREGVGGRPVRVGRAGADT